MTCPTCCQDNPDRAKFCLECGVPFALRCSSCATDLPAGAKFCLECGTATGRAAPAPERDPRSYTPKHLADKILRSKSAIEGERKHVTVPFADVKGSMELTEQVDPEEWHHILDGFFRILTDGVHRFEGTVNQYTGDGIMALFGAPIAHEDHAQRACYAALQLRDELAAYTRRVKREHGLGFSVRMGIHSGEVVVGKIGDDLRMDYTAQGHTVGLAARMQELASPDTTYLTGGTAGMVEGYFDFEDLGEFSVRGVSEAVPVFQLKGIGTVRTRMDVSRARGLTRFVGRDEDLRALESALEACFEGNGGVVGIVAEAGVGKSRLCFEFLERCPTRGVEVLEGRAVSHGKNLPFLPILQVFRAYFGITEQDDDRTAREKIAGRLLLLDEAFREALPLLFEFLGVPDPERPAPRMDPEARQRRLFEVLRRLVRSGRRDTPVVILIEDLHWIDAGSESWLAEIVEAIAGTRALLLVNFRPEYRADWMQKSYYRQIPLSPLGPDAIRELLDDLLGDDPSISGLAERIHERTVGNPFFTEEVVQSLIDGGNLEGTRGSYRLVTPVAELALPGSVHSVLAARIDRLPEREKQVLHTAAVIGKEFQEPILEEVVELPKCDLTSALAALKGAEFIYEQSLYPVAEYAFKHPLTQDVALHSQLRERRRRIHAAVAQAIERASPDKLQEQAALLAHHWEEADEKLQASRWHWRASAWAGMSHAQEALRHLRAVWELLRSVRESDETLSLRLEAAGMILTMGLRSGVPIDDLEPLVGEGQELLERCSDPRSRVQLLRGHGTMLCYSGQLREGIALLEEAIGLAEQLGDAEGGIGARVFLSIALFARGPVATALRVVDDALDLLRRSGEPGIDPMGYDTLSVLTTFRGFFLGDAGRLWEASKEVERGLARARERDDPGAAALAHLWLSRIAELRGDGSVAATHAERGVELSARLGTPNLVGLSYLVLGRAHALRGEWDSAVALLEKGVAETANLAIQQTIGAAPLAVALLRSRQAARALEAAEAAIELCRGMGARLFEADGHLALAQVLLETEGTAARERIEAAIAAAESLAREAEAVSRTPSIRLARAELAGRLGDDAARERELRTAHRLFVDMGATGHAERVARELEELGS